MRDIRKSIIDGFRAQRERIEPDLFVAVTRELGKYIKYELFKKEQ
jgi:hypothetical protein